MTSSFVAFWGIHKGSVFFFPLFFFDGLFMNIFFFLLSFARYFLSYLTIKGISLLLLHSLKLSPLFAIIADHLQIILE